MYQLLMIIALLIAMFFHSSWRDRAILLVTVLGSVILIDGLIVLVSYLFVKNDINGLIYFDFLFQALPLVLPILTWIYVEKKIRN
jgi:hypothetical protein